MNLAMQTPVPPGQQVSVTGSLEGWDAVGLFLILAALLGALLWPLIRAWARRIENAGASAEARAEIERLRERVGSLEEMPPRLLELEERVDLTERILVRGQEAAEPGRLPER